jgi:large subunit ribosomal protein L30
MTLYAVIRVRAANKKDIRHATTLKMLRLHKPNHLVLVDEKAEGMLQTVKDFITWGEITAEKLEQLVQKRGRIMGNKRVTEAFLKEHQVDSFKILVSKVMENRDALQKVGIKPVFRLNPPSKGYERAGIKKAFTVNGALGYRSEKINDLIGKMM